MNAINCLRLLLSISLGTLTALAQQPVDSTNAQNTADTAVSAQTNTQPAEVAPAQTNAAPVAPAPALTNGPPAALGSAQTNAPPQAPSAPAQGPAVEPAPAQPLIGIPESNGKEGLILNFRGAPLEMVLNYLSKAAGFIFLPDPGLDVRGRVDVWSQHPVSKDEAIDLLNTILYKNGYAAIRNGRTINIMSRDEAKKRDIPVKTGSDPDAIPRNDEIVTQIIPVRYANALQMTKDLQPLLPSYATMTANESGNALVITDTQTDIRRMAQIVKALDTSISGISTIKVFPLRYADAKDLATELRELFPAQDTSGRRGGPFGGGFGRFAGPMGGGAPGSDPTVGTGQSEARRAASRVTAVADERTNSLIVSAPDEVMPTIDELVRQIDTNAENITELRVFPLTYADPQEMADILTSLFPDDSRSDTTRSAVQFGRGPFGMFGGRGGFGGANTQTGASTRARQKGRVTAVPDPRTASLIVSAASDLMPQIAEMIAQLDANPAKKQKVFVYSLQNADVDSVQQVLQEMFQSQNSRYSSSRQNFYNPLTARQQNQSFGTTGSGFSSGFGGTGFGGMGRTGTRTGR